MTLWLLFMGVNVRQWANRASHQRQLAEAY